MTMLADVTDHLPAGAAVRSPTDRLDGPGRLLVGLEAFLSVSAFGGAAGMITGSMSLGEYADRLPFASPVLGGIALALVNGLFPAVVVAMTLRRHPWASLGHLAVGSSLMGWIVVQVAFIGLNSFIQPVMFGLGTVILCTALVQRARRHGLGG